MGSTSFLISRSVYSRHLMTDWKSGDRSLPRVIWAITFLRASFLSSKLLELSASWSSWISPRFPVSKYAINPYDLKISQFDMVSVRRLKMIRRKNFTPYLYMYKILFMIYTMYISSSFFYAIPPLKILRQSKILTN